MTKRNFILVALLFAGVCAFGELKRLNVGSYKIGDVSIVCYDDNSLRIWDSKNVKITVGCIDTDALVKASAKTKEIMERNNIRSVEQMLKFFDREKINYEIKKFENSSDYYVQTQAFLEEYLVPKYGIKPGWKRFFSNFTAELKNWNKAKQWYDYSLDTYADHTSEYKNWNNDKQRYEYNLDKYADHTEEYKNWNGDWYDYCLETYADHTEERKNWNKVKQHHDYCLYTYADHTVEFKNWNGDFYDYYLETYADHTEEFKNWNKDKKNYDYRLYTGAGITIEATNWNKYYDVYDYELTTSEGFTIVKKRVDGTYFDVDIKDKSGNPIAYAHVIKPLKGGTRDIEVFSGGVVYQYFGVKETKDGKLAFKSMEKKENGVTTKMKGSTLFKEDFYMDAYMLQ